MNIISCSLVSSSNRCLERNPPKSPKQIVGVVAKIKCEENPGQVRKLVWASHFEYLSFPNIRY